MNQTSSLLFSLRSMSVYRNLLKDRVVESLTALLDEEEKAFGPIAALYGTALAALLESGMTLSDYIYCAVLYDDNRFTRLSAQDRTLSTQLLGAARYDLRALSALAYLTPQTLKDVLIRRFPAMKQEIDGLPVYSTGHERFLADQRDWGNELRALGDFCKENGCGAYARCRVCDSEETLQRLWEICDTPERKILLEKLKAL